LILDLFFNYNLFFFLFFFKAIFTILEKLLLESDMEDIMKIMKNLKWHINDDDVLINTIEKIKVPEWILKEFSDLFSNYI
jgi:hypothetical protein